MKKFAPVLFALIFAGHASARTDGEALVKQKLDEASSLAFAAVGDLDTQVNYIKSGSQNPPVDGCDFCSDDAVEENDGDVLEHIARISRNASNIGDLALKASQETGSTLQTFAKQACDLTRSTLNDIPAAKATISWAPVGIARPNTFDATERKLQRVKSLLPTCF